MPAATGKLALPYPVPDDAVDVPRDVKALAEKLDAANMPVVVATTAPATPVTGQRYFNASTGQTFTWDGTQWRLDGPPVVTTLPASPVDGQEVYLQFTGEVSPGPWPFLQVLTWHLRYRAALTTYKWEFLGGPALFAADSTAFLDTQAAWITGAPFGRVPRPGIYDVAWGAYATEAVAYPYVWEYALVREGEGVQAELVVRAAGPSGGGASVAHTMAGHGTKTMLAGERFVAGYNIAGNQAYFSNRWLWYQPIVVN